MSEADRRWVTEAIRRIEADFTRSADTHLIRLDLPSTPDIQLYLKDESVHPTGSLKHRLARSLYLYGLCNGWIHRGTPVIEASSGSTAVSEAYFARLLDLRFIAVVPEGTSREKIEQIQFYGGECHFVQPAEIYSEASHLAEQLGGHYMDQFTYAERATDWRGNNNITESIFSQMAAEPHPMPRWIVMSAGTGGTSATIGRYLRYRCHETRLCVADPENSVFYEHYQHPDRDVHITTTSRIEGIGRPRVEASFVASVVDRMIKVPDAASLATIHALQGLLNRRCGGSTGTNLYAAFHIIAGMHRQRQSGSVVTLICDSGERYRDTYYDTRWLEKNGFDLQPFKQRLQRFFATGALADGDGCQVASR
ncbi:MAG: PLP-dependent cysteine synthase family protein [Proteobacteria bacterium]|nr:MAG: PLP-dependent cysteine synthase family protein [Pseudomonadota bacterium]QKK12375.1 MAG: PLP-dependent cysteine synthase family protein [Pseudomonadota bacterium]